MATMSSALTGRTPSSNSTRSLSRFLRNEHYSNNLRDFGLKKGLDHLDAVRTRFQSITDRFAAFHRTEEAVRKFFTEEMGRRRCHTLQVVCMDMWAPFAKLVKDHAPQAQLLFDRFHIVKHLNEAVDTVRRQLWRRVTAKEKVAVKGTRWLLLKNPWNLNDEQKERLSTLVRWNTPLVRARYLKEAFQLFWGYQQPKRACSATARQTPRISWRSGCAQR